MAKYGKNNYFDGVILPEPKEEALRRMAKGVNCSDGGFMSAAAELNVVPCSIQCVFKPMVLTDSPQTVFAMSNSASAPRIDLHNGYITAYLGYNSIRIYDIAVDTVYDFVFVCDSDKSILYVNGNLAASFADVSRCSGYKLGYLLVNSTKYHFQGDYLLHRHFNYAMSANEVKALDNTGDPAGYMLPDTMKDSTPVEIIGKNSRTWTGVDAPVSSDIKINRVLSVGGAFRITGSVSNYKSGTPYLNLGHNSIAYLPKDNSPFTLVVTLKEEISTLFPYIYIYGGSSSEDKQLTITVDSVELVGCIAEYLPHNLIPTAEGSVVKWLDSAPQLPEANGILPPLDASVGGYDLAAIGNPKIII